MTEVSIRPPVDWPVGSTPRAASSRSEIARVSRADDKPPLCRFPTADLVVAMTGASHIDKRKHLAFFHATSCSIPSIPPIMLSSSGSKRALFRSIQFRAARTFTTTSPVAKPNATASASSLDLRTGQVSSFGSDNAPFVPVETVVDLQGKGLRKGSSEYRRHIRVSPDFSLLSSILICCSRRPSLRNMICFIRVRSQSRRILKAR